MISPLLRNIMGKTSSQSFYAVARGRRIGIFDSWSECRSHINGFSNARYKKFSSREEASRFIKDNSGTNLDKVKSAFGLSHKSIPEPKRPSTEGFSIDDTDWLYDADLGYSLNKDGWVRAFTDGACSNNGRKGAVAGIGVYFGPKSRKNISKPVSGDHQTNNSAEIQAISRAIQSVKDDNFKKISIFTDSKFVMNSVELWMPSWKKNGWKKASGGEVINKADFIELDEIMKGMTVKFIHVRGHQGIDGNEFADQLAREGSMK